MFAVSPDDVRNLPLLYIEKSHRSRKRWGFHVFLSRYFLDSKGASDVKRHEAGLGFLGIVIKIDFDDNSDDGATNYNVDAMEILCSFRTQDTMKLACSP